MGVVTCVGARREARASGRHYNAAVIIESSAPTRIDLAGGTLDIWPLYLFHDRAQTLNAALTLRAHCRLSPLPGHALVLRSEDTGTELRVGHWSELRATQDLKLLGKILHFFEVDGVEVTTRSESPVGAGIAGSSALNIAVCGAVARWRGLDLTDTELLQIAMNVEAQTIDVPTGVQDYRPALYGGVSAVELRVDGIRRVKLDVDAADLGSRLVVAYTGATRNSGINNWDVTKRYIDGDAAVRASFDRIARISTALRASLVARDWDAVARHIADEWEARKHLAPGVTTPAIDRLIAKAADAGASAAKVCGAGGGGCLFCFAAPSDTPAVRAALTAGGAQVLDCTIDDAGLRIDVREG